MAIFLVFIFHPFAGGVAAIKEYFFHDDVDYVVDEGLFIGGRWDRVDLMGAKIIT